MDPYFPSPNPPCAPKPCQRCGTRVDGEETEGWWLERERWQSPNCYQLLCLSCCVDAMNEESGQPNVADETELRELLYD
ncbi:hypothetical protein GWG54_15335 [Natronococcus sp. JC468]|uniref:hypothetical protein n=1 Tax=Natronococcus sp. JC468 TaxID=1961921 RepID=UPI00143A1264|nr:hypothetical protein [Natronococcus sp. JC468]NKE37170.1 hypothetical protein [Natronococcus sp. JC468]